MRRYTTDSAIGNTHPNQNLDDVVLECYKPDVDWNHYSAKQASKALAQYLAVLQRVYPIARGTASVLVRPDHRIIVSVPLPKSSRERMRLFDRMAEIGTKLLLDTDEYIILSGR